MGRHQIGRGVRLRRQNYTVNRTRVVAIGHADLDQPKCVKCDKPISDDRMWRDGAKQHQRFCSEYCRGRYYQGHVGRTLTHGVPSGREGRWKDLYAQARTARGGWVSAACRDERDASQSVNSINQRRDFEARKDGLTIYVRFVVAA